MRSNEKRSQHGKATPAAAGERLGAEVQVEVPASAESLSRWVLLLAVLSFGSGCAALIYEIVWFQLLEFVVGSSAVSLAVLLGTFMSGLCLGSFLLARIISSKRHPLRVYALLELGIGVFGLAVLLGMPLVGRIYSTSVGRGFSGMLLRGLVSIICLLPPTVLMGATLPAIARFLEATRRGAFRLGYLYSANTVGAVVGALVAGFYVLRIYDLAIATYAALTLNSLLAVTAMSASAYMKYRPATVAEPPLIGRGQPANDWPVYVVIGISGLSALAAEVIWTRLLSLLLGPTVYSFSIILACFLTGLGMGSGVGSFLARRIAKPRLALGCCQFLLMLAMAFAAYLLYRFFPQQIYTPPPDLFSKFQSDVIRCFLTTLPATLLWGASFPLALAAAASPEYDPGRLLGEIYAANTMGAIVGATITSLLLIVWLGTPNVQRLLIWSSAMGAVLLFGSGPRWSHAGESNRQTAALRGSRRTGAIVGSLTLAWLLTAQIDPVPGLLVAFGPYAGNSIGHADLLYTGEGMSASVAVSEGEGIRSFHVSGKVEASNAAPDMQHLRLLALLPALAQAQARSVLVIGCGAGITAGSFLPYSNVDRITIVEIEPLIPQRVTPFFRQENYNLLQDSRVKLIYDDGRHYVLTTPEKFDIITSDPIHPWVKGSASLYTREYFELVKRHLNPGGLVTQWVPLYESSPDVVRSEIATFFDVFPSGTVWSSEPVGSDLVLLGQANPSSINADAIESRVQHSQAVAELLRSAGYSTARDLLASYAGRAVDMKPWLEGAEINRDRSLRLQYLAGLRVGWENPESIYASLIRWRKYPDNLFLASETLKDQLKRALK